MRPITKLLLMTLIGVTTVTTSLLGTSILTTAAPNEFTLPRQMTGYLVTSVSTMSRAQVDQSLWELQRLWEKTRIDYEKQLSTPSFKNKLAKYKYTDVLQLRNITDPDVQQMLTNIMADNYRLTRRNGTYRLVIDYSMVTSKFSRYASQTVASYFEVIAKMDIDRFYINGALKIAPNDLATRLAKTELFLTAHPNFPKKSSVKATYQRCLALYLLGGEKSPAFSGDKLNVNFLESYQQAAAKYQGSSFGASIAQYLTILKKNNFKKTPEVQDFVKQKTA